MALFDLMRDTRAQLAGTLIMVLVGGYFYLESVVSHVDTLRKDFVHAQKALDTLNKAWLDEEMRHLDRISAGQAELRRMILDACTERGGS